MSTQHPWHQVSTGENVPEVVNAIIEIPKGSKAKYEIDKESGLLKLDRVLFSSVMYPANYGFIPQTYCDDKDPLDILVLCSVDVFPMSMTPLKVAPGVPAAGLTTRNMFMLPLSSGAKYLLRVPPA